MVQRYKFESKSQHTTKIQCIFGSCFQWFKGTNLKANHNTMNRVLSPVNSCFQWFKGTNLKANHNWWYVLQSIYSVVSNGSKVQIWKQITTKHNQLRFRVKLFSKVQIWKQITTTLKYLSKKWTLFPMVQRYKFESKSQPIPSSIMPYFVVSNGSKVQIWKQITTACSYGNSGSRIVSNGSKIRIWKQITTFKISLQ